MPSIETFLRPIDLLKMAVTSRLQPEFAVLLMPSAVLHGSTIRGLSDAIQLFLEQGKSVRIELNKLQDFGVPQERQVLTLVSAPAGGTPLDIHPRADTGNSKIMDFIQDLTFTNPRASEGSRGGFVCFGQDTQDNGGVTVSRHFYNHQTSQSRNGAVSTSSLDADAKSISLTCNSPEAITHPSKLRKRSQEAG